MSLDWSGYAKISCSSRWGDNQKEVVDVRSKSVNSLIEHLLCHELPYTDVRSRVAITALMLYSSLLSLEFWLFSSSVGRLYRSSHLQQPRRRSSLSDTLGNHKCSSVADISLQGALRLRHLWLSVLNQARKSHSSHLRQIDPWQRSFLPCWQQIVHLYVYAKLLSLFEHLQNRILHPIRHYLSKRELALGLIGECPNPWR